MPGLKSVTLFSVISFFLFLFCNVSLAQKNNDTLLTLYCVQYDKISQLLSADGSFKEAVFLSEVAFMPGIAKDDYYNNFITQYSKLISRYSISAKLSGYKKQDTLNYRLNLSISTFMSGEIPLKYDTLEIHTLPFTYNFTDPQGDQDWANTFVTKLLSTHKGNCSSLTYLYKILADSLGAKCWLALAPNHIYIRNYSKQTGWYNTELTSGTFPTDAWIAATGYVSTDAIRSGVYMDTLSNRQSIGLCLLGLAQGYLKQTKNYTDGFVLKCCNLVLQYHAVNPEALLLKAEVLKRTYLEDKEENNTNVQNSYHQMEETYITLAKLGYREMPLKTYQKWLKTVNQQKGKYVNSKIKAQNNP